MMSAPAPSPTTTAATTARTGVRTWEPAATAVPELAEEATLEALDEVPAVLKQKGTAESSARICLK